MKPKIFSIEVNTPVRFRQIDEKTSEPVTGWMTGFTTDMSLEGMKLIAPMSEAEVEMLVRKYGHIDLSCHLPGTSKAIAATGAIVYFLRGAAISNATKITLDVSFVAIDHSTRDIIGEFIRQRINSPILNKIFYIPDKKILNSHVKPQVPWMSQANYAV